MDAPANSFHQVSVLLQRILRWRRYRLSRNVILLLSRWYLYCHTELIIYSTALQFEVRGICDEVSAKCLYMKILSQRILQWEWTHQPIASTRCLYCYKESCGGAVTGFRAM